VNRFTSSPDADPDDTRPDDAGVMPADAPTTLPNAAETAADPAPASGESGIFGPQQKGLSPHRQVAIAVNEGYFQGGGFFGSIIAGLLLGALLDWWLGTAPIFIVVGIVLGAVNGFYRTHGVMKRQMAKHEAERRIRTVPDLELDDWGRPLPTSPETPRADEAGEGHGR
jgi:hypothetical protein